MTVDEKYYNFIIYIFNITIKRLKDFLAISASCGSNGCDQRKVSTENTKPFASLSPRSLGGLISVDLTPRFITRDVHIRSSSRPLDRQLRAVSRNKGRHNLRRDTHGGA